VTVYLAVVFSALVCGLAPSILTAVVGTAGIVYWFIDPRNSFRIADWRDIHGLIACVLACAALIALGEANRRKRLRLNEAREELERRVEERAHELSREAARVRAQAEWLDAANDAIFVGDSDEKIAYWNKGAERLYGWARAEAIGRSPHELLRSEFPIPFEEIARRRQEGDWQGELVHTRRDGTKVTVASRWTALKDAHNNLTGWFQINTDITKRKAAEESTRQLSAQLLRTQDEERRRLARELHDSAGQILAALAMNLGQLQASIEPNARAAQLLADSERLLKDVISELRTISHLLHPPLLDEVGLPSALQWYIDGFAKRSGIDAKLQLTPNLGRLPSDFEITIFRIVQECLTNVHRHSGSATAEVRLAQSDGHLRIEIRDQGKGMPVEKRLSLSTAGPMGVGLRGMRERVTQLGGTLDVRSSDSGTAITALLPVKQPVPAAQIGEQVA
jgi:PAS domain S-box-containing protein